jgi:hypothetical protein
LWRGEVGLARTYWLWAFLIGGGVALVVGSGAAIVGTLTGTRFPYAVAQAYTIIWTAFISVAVWRSAGNYKGRTIWKVLARIGSVFGVVFVALILISLFLRVPFIEQIYFPIRRA